MADRRRADGRTVDELRPVSFTPDFQPYAEGSVLVSFGATRVVCSVSVEEKVPAFLKGQARGWITAEYSMLPRSTLTRTNREAKTGRQGGRTQEIQRLIGRSLRSCADMKQLGERTLTIDCDVLQADGGTRTAAITGAYVALNVACRRLVDDGQVTDFPLHSAVAAVSTGIVDGASMVDLAYEEDGRAEVDFNVVMTDDDEFVEIQGTAEGKPFDRAAADQLIDAAHGAIRQLFDKQNACLAAWPPRS